MDEKTQLLMNSKASKEIFDYINEKHNRVILVGDFNHNPFDGFMNSNITLNSIPNRKIVHSLKTRPHDYLQKTLFYNPMWNFLGDYDFSENVEKYNGPSF